MFLRACGVFTVSGLGLAGFNAGFHDATAWPFYASLATFAAHLAWQVESADLSDPANLGARFRSNGVIAPVVLVGIAAATLNS
jgi:4-hydroxybenzoate polyprenyltransferase